MTCVLVLGWERVSEQEVNPDWVSDILVLAKVITEII